MKKCIEEIQGAKRESIDSALPIHPDMATASLVKTYVSQQYLAYSQSSSYPVIRCTVVFNPLAGLLLDRHPRLKASGFDSQLWINGESCF